MHVNNRLTIIATGLIVVVAVIGLFGTGRLVWVSSGGHVAASAVCGTDIVSKYNTATNFIGRNGNDGSNPSIDTAGVAAVKKEITAKSGYKNDATCQAILFWIAINDNDYPAAKTAESIVKQLHDKGMSADSNIRGNTALSTYDGMLEIISPTNKEKPGAAA